VELADTREQAKLVHLLIEKVGYDGRTARSR
jgi:hypothetical protein